MSDHRFDVSDYRVKAGKDPDLGSRLTRADVEGFEKADAIEALAADREHLADAQRVLYADGRRAVLIVLQALDAAGKDGTIRHVMSGVNPQGCSVTSFKAPTPEEAAHHFLWRPTPHLPRKGHIAIFNRSYYEETLVVRVHPEWLAGQSLPSDVLKPKWMTPQALAEGGPPESFWQDRFDAINGFERMLVESGTTILKFYLHLSRGEQKERFLERIRRPEKNWKFSSADIRERGHWDDYQRVYSETIRHTSTSHAPWYVIPADQKWFSRSLIGDIISRTIMDLDVSYPTLPADEKERLAEAERELLSEDA